MSSEIDNIIDVYCDCCGKYIGIATAKGNEPDPDKGICSDCWEDIKALFN